MKAYVKPDLFCEDYVLNQTIAAGCTWKIRMGQQKDCIYGLDDTLQEYLKSDNVESYCYTNGTEFGNIMGLWNS